MFESLPSCPPFQATARPRRGAVATVIVAVSLLHGLALDAAETGPESIAAPRSVPLLVPLSVRWIEPAAGPAAVELPPALVEPVPAAPRAETRRPPARVRPQPVPLATLALNDAPPPAPAEPTERLGDPATAAPPPSVDASVARPTTAVPPAAPAASGPIAPEAPIPVYKTRIAPPMTLRYELRRGGITGTGELQWQPQDKHYELRLEGKVAGITLLTQVSQGDIDAHGLAPLRFTDQRTRRAVQAANFQRDKGVISFSGPTEQYALVPGVQDRLSWMLQLGAIVAAEPARAKAGQKVSLYVVGSRGEVDTWVMDFVGAETVQGAGTAVRALKFEREARKPMDSHIEIWLDPARNYLPVHAKQASGGEGSGDVFELLLRDADGAR